MKSIHVAIACGGTGGHIHPALAVAETLKSQSYKLSLILSGTRVAEQRTADTWQGPLLKSGARPIKDLRNFLAILRCLCFLRRQKPDVLFATGGYTSFAPVVAARMLKIPVVMHEANSRIGRAVRFLSRHCNINTVALSFEDSAKQIPWAHTVFTGLPLRSSVLNALARARATRGKREGEALSILVTGGSQGAHGMNKLVTPVLASLAASDKNVTVLHQCGKADEASITEAYAATEGRAKAVPFIDDIGSAYAQADIVIARAGAATCFEIARCAIPTIFIPLPTAADDHQTKNAQALAECGGAVCINQRTSSPEQFADILRSLYSDSSLRTSMRSALEALPHTDAAAAVADILVAAAQA